MTTDKMEAGDFVQAYCKKCQRETKSVAVALENGLPTKVQCTICKGNHLFKKAAPAPAVSRAKSEASKAELQEWQNLSAQWNPAKANAYRTDAVFKKGELVSHATFGLGAVVEAPGYKRVTILFQSGKKMMQCGN